jgi:hypothetical protein
LNEAYILDLDDVVNTDAAEPRGFDPATTVAALESGPEASLEFRSSPRRQSSTREEAEVVT